MSQRRISASAVLRNFGTRCPVFGEVVTPRDFNTLKRIADEDESVIEEQESFLELASSEALLAELQKVLSTDAQRWLTDLVI